MGPKISHHRWSGRAYVTVNGKRTYLGKWNGAYPIPKEIQVEYRRVVAAAFSGSPPPDPTPEDPTVAELCVLFLDNEAAKLDKSDRNGYRRVAADLVGYCGRLPAKALGAAHAKALLGVWQGKGLARTTINKNLKKLQRIVRYGVAEEVVPPGCQVAVEAVQTLRGGLPGVREVPRVQPVSRERVLDTLPFLRPVPRGIIQLLLTTGARPGEICKMRMRDIDRSGAVWKYIPEKHKTQWRGRERVIPLGPAAQAALSPWLSADPEKYLFAVSRLGKPYSVDALHHQVQRACLQHGIPVWNPRQIRKLVAQYLRDQIGLEAAQSVLGHSTPQLTAEIYAARTWEQAIKASKAIPGL
jgi:integrase